MLMNVQKFTASKFFGHPQISLDVLNVAMHATQNILAIVTMVDEIVLAKIVS